MKMLRDIKRAYTLAEIIIVLVVISVVVACTMRVAKNRLDNITAYTYYSAYGVLNDVTAQMLADYNPNSTDYTDIAQNKINSERLATVGNSLRNDISTSYTNLFLFAHNFDRLFRVAHNYDFVKYVPTQNANAATTTTPVWLKDVKAEDYDSLTPVWLCDYDKMWSEGWAGTEFYSNIMYGNCAMNCALSPVSLSICGSKLNAAYVNKKVYCSNAIPLSIKLPAKTSMDMSYTNPYGQYNNNDPNKDWVFNNGVVTRVFSNRLTIRLTKKQITSLGDNANFSCQYTCTPNITMYNEAKNSCAADQTVEWDSKSCTFSCSGGSSGSSETPSSGEDPKSCTQLSAEQQRRDYCLYGKTEYNAESCTYGKEDTSCERGKHWSSTEPNCGCVPDDTTIPRKGTNFCKLFVSLVNTKAGATCNGSAISSDTTDFSAAGITEDFTLRNGMKVYNVSQNPIRIADLVGNTDVGTVTKADGTQIKTNEWGYVLYIDIDGDTSGDSKLWEDVYPFYVTLSGRVIPAYKTDNASDYNLYGGGSRYYLQTSIQVDTSGASGSRQYWLADSKSISFRESACRSGYVGAATNYCKRGTSIGLNGTCESENSSCTIKKVSPIRVF